MSYFSPKTVFLGQAGCAPCTEKSCEKIQPCLQLHCCQQMDFAAHTRQELESTELVGFNLEEDVKVSINTILHDLRKIFRSGIYLACSQSPLLRITLNQSCVRLGISTPIMILSPTTRTTKLDEPLAFLGWLGKQLDDNTVILNKII